MTHEALIKRWPGLARLPREPLLEGPTPFRRLEGGPLGEAVVWVKDDGQTASSYGGNKVRKLEYLFGDARMRGREVLLTAGAFGSHHVLATAIHGARSGFEVEAVLSPQPITAHVVDNVRADLAAGATLHPQASGAGLATAGVTRYVALSRAGRRPYPIGIGGSTPRGVLGYVAGALELISDLEASGTEPDAIYLAYGSGGTAAGLAIGLAAVGRSIPIVAVRVVDRAIANSFALGALITATTRQLRRLDPRFPNVAQRARRLVRVLGEELGPGYGRSTERSEAALRDAGARGLWLDATYTAKAFAALQARAARGPGTYVFLQTLSATSRRLLLEGAPVAPSWLKARG